MDTQGDTWGASTFTVEHVTRRYYHGSNEDEARKTANLLLAGVVDSGGTATVTLYVNDLPMETYKVENGYIVSEGGKLLEGRGRREMT